MNNFAVDFDVGPVFLLPGSQFKELQTGVRVQPQFPKDGVDEVVGKVEGEIGNGVETPENEETADPVEQFGAGHLVFVPGLPSEGW